MLVRPAPALRSEQCSKGRTGHTPRRAPCANGNAAVPACPCCLNSSTIAGSERGLLAAGHRSSLLPRPEKGSSYSHWSPQCFSPCVAVTHLLAFGWRNHNLRAHPPAPLKAIMCGVACLRRSSPGMACPAWVHNPVTTALRMPGPVPFPCVWLHFCFPYCACGERCVLSLEVCDSA